MGLIPDDIIETVRLRSDIVEVVSRYVRLKKKGKYYTGFCPFHQERAPSFTVTPDKQIFHCFGCHTGGNVFKFLMLKDNLTFVEAVRVLAQQAGIPLPAGESPAEQERGKKTARMRQINSLASDYYRDVLQHQGAAAGARKYLAGRGFLPEVLAKFQVGFALPGGDALIKHLEKEGFHAPELVETGLAGQNESGRYYDRFRRRIMFPIWDAMGRIVGFGGRVLDQSVPKYMNSPETALFNKGHLLYGLHLAKEAIRQKGYVVIMEGYMDVITAHRFGVNNAVASLGTSLTREQVRLLVQYTRNVVIAYDADAAGVAATMRGLDLLQEAGCQVRVVRIPDGKDPDDFFQRHGYQAWEDLIAKAYPLIEYKLQQAVGHKQTVTVSEKLAAMRQVFPGITGLSSEIERQEDLKRISRFLGLSPEAVTAEFKRFQANLAKKYTNTDNIVNIKHNILSKVKYLSPRERAEAVLLRVILEDPSLVETVLVELGEEPFKNTIHQNIFKQFRLISKESFYKPAAIFNFLKDDEQILLSNLLTQHIPGENRIQIMRGCVEFINRCCRQERREALLMEIGKAEKSGAYDQYRHLWHEYILLRKITEAERTGNYEQIGKLLQDYRQFLESDTWEHPREGSEGAERRN